MITLQGICSGGQTGADQGGLEAAAALNIYTYGWAPKGFKTERGLEPHLGELYNLNEHPSEDYPARTKANVLSSDATLIFGKRSRGSNRTEEECRKADKPCMWVGPHMAIDRTILLKIVRLWLRSKKVKYLNVAGNRESVNPGIHQYTKEFLIEALSK